MSQGKSQIELRQFFKTDVAFARGYQTCRNGFRRDLIIHIVQIVILTIFLPIKVLVLYPSGFPIAAIVVGITTSIICTLVLSVEYYILFKKGGLAGYCQLGTQTLHSTEQKVTELNGQQSCTSEIVLHAATGVLLEGATPRVIQVYGNMSKFQIHKVCQQIFPSIPYWWRLEYFVGATGMIIVVILMVTSDRLNPTEIVILCCFLGLQALCRWIFLLVFLQISLSPIVAIVLLLWVCFCGPKEVHKVINLPSKAATPEDIIQCDGQCAVCIQSIDPDSQIYQLPCSNKHIFHVGCLNNWSRMKLTCPVCRGNLPFRVVKGNPVQVGSSK